MNFTRVECRSDHDYIGHPLAFDWLDKRLPVVEILTQSRTPHGYSFRVRTEDYGVFALNYDANTDEWSVLQL